MPVRTYVYCSGCAHTQATVRRAPSIRCLGCRPLEKGHMGGLVAGPYVWESYA